MKLAQLSLLWLMYKGSFASHVEMQLNVIRLYPHRDWRWEPVPARSWSCRHSKVNFILSKLSHMADVLDDHCEAPMVRISAGKGAPLIEQD